MANITFDNTYYIDTTTTNALAWNSGSVINNVIIWAIDTTAVAQFVLAGSNPGLTGPGTALTIFRFSIMTQGAGTSIMPSTWTVDMGKTRFPTAWIPTTLTACTAWINFA